MSKQTTLDAALAELQKIRRALEKDSGKTFEQHVHNTGDPYADAHDFKMEVRRARRSSTPGSRERSFNQEQFDQLNAMAPKRISRLTPRASEAPGCLVEIRRELWDRELSRYEPTQAVYSVTIMPTSDRSRTDVVQPYLSEGAQQFRVINGVSRFFPLIGDEFKVHLPRYTAIITQSMIETAPERDR